MNDLADILAPAAVAPLRGIKSDRVHHALRRAILLGELRAGAPVLEQRVAAAMGCSQGTVREALLRLEQDGLVRRRGRRGTEVSATSFGEAAQMARIRLALEVESAARAAASADVGAALDPLVARMLAAETARDGYALSEIDREFHIAVLRLAGLDTLTPILVRCSLHLHRFTFGAGDPPAMRAERVPALASAEAHARLRDAIGAGGAAAAAAAMRAHIEGVLGAWSQPLLDAALRPPPG